MRELHLKMSMSLDGFVAGPNHELEWIFRTNDDKADAWTNKLISEAGLHIMGAKTFRDMISWWPFADDDTAGPMNRIPKAVFTQHAGELRKSITTEAVYDMANSDASKAAEASGQQRKKEADPKALKGWQDSYIAEGAMKDELAKLKRQDGGPIMAHGGAGFARSLIATGMVDEYQLLVHPVVLGEGLPIFTKVSKPLTLKLIESKTFPKGEMAHVYRPG